MYNQAENFEKLKNTINCRYGTRKIEEQFIKNHFLEWKITACRYPSDYIILTYLYEDRENYIKYSYYFKSGRLFFIYEKSNSVAIQSESRIYLDETSNPIRILGKKDEIDTSNLKNEIIENNIEKEEIFSYALIKLKEGIEMIKSSR
jgi:hypothetical protein